MTAAEICRDLALNPASYARARRRILAEADGLRSVRIAALSTCTLHTFEAVLFVEAALRGLRLDWWFAPFGQLEAPILEPDGPLHRHQPDVLLLFTRLDDLLPGMMQRFVTHDATAQQLALEGLINRLRGILESYRSRSTAPVLVANFAPPTPLAAGLADAGSAASQSAFVHGANIALAAICREIPGVFVFDFAHFASEQGTRSLDDPRLRHMARVPFGLPGQIAFARRLARAIHAATRPPSKVLVLDLDNTLWGGIVGEDGPGGIQIGDDYPGSIFKEFQHYILSLRDRGVLLAIASKNNEADVNEVFAGNRDCLVKRGDFSAIRINWSPKSEGITSMAAELNLGLDAFVFFDDNPVERAEVRAALPMVRVIEVPEDPLGYIDAIEESGAFDVLSLNADDLGRAAAYEARASASAIQASSPEDFLRSLEMRVTIGPMDPLTLPRIVQLLGKTNQFNLTTRRHGEADVQRIVDAGGIVLWARAADRFGDHGLTAVIIALPERETRWRVDSLLMSCRIIGRGVERALLAQASREIARRGGAQLVGEYVPTAKNAQVATFYADLAFEATGEGTWVRDITNAPLEAPAFIQIEVLS